MEKYDDKGLTPLIKDAENIFLWANPGDSANPEVPCNDTACFGYGGTAGSYPSDVTRLAAEAHSMPFLNRYDAFNGAGHDEGPRAKRLMISDGVHPSDFAAEYTADLLAEMSAAPVTPPRKRF